MPTPCRCRAPRSSWRTCWTLRTCSSGRTRRTRQRASARRPAARRRSTPGWPSQRPASRRPRTRPPRSPRSEAVHAERDARRKSAHVRFCMFLMAAAFALQRGQCYRRWKAKGGYLQWHIKQCVRVIHVCAVVCLESAFQAAVCSFSARMYRHPVCHGCGIRFEVLSFTQRSVGCMLCVRPAAALGRRFIARKMPLQLASVTISSAHHCSSILLLFCYRQ